MRKWYLRIMAFLFNFTANSDSVGLQKIWLVEMAGNLMNKFNLIKQTNFKFMEKVLKISLKHWS